jgi:hypothetical protein
MKRDSSVVGIDIAKPVFHLVGMDERASITASAIFGHSAYTYCISRRNLRGGRH